MFDQFLRRRSNQLYFGVFIGLALYALLVLASITPSHHPVYGVALAGVLTVAALYMLILLIYTTIDQSRPVVILRTIHDHTLVARERQLRLVQGTRRTPRLHGSPAARVLAEERFDLRQQTERLEAIYDRVLAGSRSPNGSSASSA